MAISAKHVTLRCPVMLAGTTQPAVSGRTLAGLEDVLQPASPQSDPTLSPVNACKMLLEVLLTHTSLPSTEEVHKVTAYEMV